MNVIFLDFDGVVNIPYWIKNEDGSYKSRFNHPSHGTVNSFQAIQWVSEFCQKYDYSIVISSTWRLGNCDCTKILYDSGLRENIKIIGKTPRLPSSERGNEITMFLNEHKEITNYLIFDDDKDMNIHMDRLVHCDYRIGFTLREYEEAVRLHGEFAS